MGIAEYIKSYVSGGFLTFSRPEVDKFGKYRPEIWESGVGEEGNHKVISFGADADDVGSISEWMFSYLYSLLRKRTVMFSDMPEAIDPFLLVLIEKN